MFDMAARAAKVAIEQTDMDSYYSGGRRNISRLPMFLQRVLNFRNDTAKFGVTFEGKLSKNDFCKNFKQLRSKVQRKVYVKLLTNRFFLSELADRGFDVETPACRICNDGSIENSAHFFSAHLPELFKARSDPSKISSCIIKRKIPDNIFLAATPARKKAKKDFRKQN